MLLPGPAGFQHGQSGRSIPATCPVSLRAPGRARSRRSMGADRRHSRAFSNKLASWLRHGLGRLCSRRRLLSRPKPSDASQNGPMPRVPAAATTPSAFTSGPACLKAMTPSRAQILNALPAMSSYLPIMMPPRKWSVTRASLLAQDGPVGFSAAVLPYLRAFPGLSREARSRSFA